MADAFTEEELPRRSIMVCGRSIDGQEIAVMLPWDDEERCLKIITKLREALLFNDGIQNASD